MFLLIIIAEIETFSCESRTIPRADVEMGILISGSDAKEKVTKSIIPL